MAVYDELTALHAAVERLTAKVTELEVRVACLERRAEESDAIAPDTDVPLTVAQMAEQFDRLGKPTSEEDVELGVDPDDYRLS